MKKSKAVITLILALMTVLAPLSSYACKCFNCTETQITDGNLYLGRTSVSIENDESHTFSYTPAKDGFYAVDYTEGNVGFADSYDEFGYYPVSFTCGTSEEGTYDIYELESGKTYTFIIEKFCDSDAAKDIDVEISYLGTITDIECPYAYAPLNSDGEYIFHFDNEYGISNPSDILPDITFSSGRTIRECRIGADSCGGCYGVMLDENFKASEGEHKVKVSALGFEKEITINFFDPADYVEINPFKDGFVPSVINGKYNDKDDETITFTTPDGVTHNVFEGYELCTEYSYIVYVDCGVYESLPVITDENTTEQNEEALHFYIAKGLELMLTDFNFRDGSALISNALDAFNAATAARSAMAIDY